MALQPITHFTPPTREAIQTIKPDQPAKSHQAADTPIAPKGLCSGTHRLVALDATIARAKAVMPLLGITRVANVTGLDTIGIPVVMITRPNAKSLSVAQGKGPTLKAAMASGLMEAIESHHAESITLPLLLASWSQLCFTHSLPASFDGLPHFPGRRLGEHDRILWIEAQSLTGSRAQWLPYDLVHTDFTLPLPSGSGTFFMSSGGLASGNHRLEAITHGLCELIERDAATLWQCMAPAQQQRRRVDPHSVDDPLCRDMLDRYERAGVGVMLWDISSDVGVAAFKCVIFDRTLNSLRPIAPMGGLGCHPVAAIALLRALTEAAQSRATTVAGARDDMIYARPDIDRCRKTLQKMALRHQAVKSMRPFEETPSHHHDSFDEDVAFLLKRLDAAGLPEALFVDLTKPELLIPVVRVIVPGLEIFCDLPGFQPGRRARAALAQRCSS